MKEEIGNVCIKVFQAHYPAIDPNVIYTEHDLKNIGAYYCSPNDIHRHVEAFREFAITIPIMHDDYDLYRIYKDFHFQNIPHFVCKKKRKNYFTDGKVVRKIDDVTLSQYAIMRERDVCFFSLEEKLCVIDNGLLFKELSEHYDDTRHIRPRIGDGLYYISSEQLRIIKRHFPQVILPREDVYEVFSLFLYVCKVP